MRNSLVLEKERHRRPQKHKILDELALKEVGFVRVEGGFFCRLKMFDVFNAV